MASSKYIKRVVSEFQEIGFSQVDKKRLPASAGTWLEKYSDAESDLRTFLWLEAKPVSQIITVQIGWRKDAAHDFCVNALKNDWPAGYRWLEEVEVLSIPCLQAFNLAYFMQWPSMGLVLDDTFEIELFRLKTALLKGDVIAVSSDALLARFLRDEEPALWFAGNTALRIAEIAGLCDVLKKDKQVVIQIAEDHLQSIQQDMYSLGQAQDWITSLVKKLDSAP